MKLTSCLLLFFIAVPCLAKNVTIDPTSTTKAEDANSMANVYRLGMGVPKDMKKAFELYQVAAELGNTDAQVDLGDFYYGGEETKQSYSQANYWYEKAATKGNATAQLYLGYAYLEGKGVTVDYDKSRYWLELAVKQDQPSAKYHLGTLYLEGNGVTKNKEKANKLFQDSCAGGEPMACEKLKTAEKSK